MAAASQVKLTENDTAVLSALFDPEASLRNVVHVDPFLATDDYNLKTLQSIQREELAALLPINVQAPTASDIKRAITNLSLLIERWPRYPSSYNNRAQATRMLYPFEVLLQHPEEIQRIVSDLNHAIMLASPSSPAAAVSPTQAKVLAAAHTHRGYLLLRLSKSDDLETAVSFIPEIKGIPADKLEELASRDFAAGGRYGNTVAQQLAVKSNPYAKLCGNIVRKPCREK